MPYSHFIKPGQKVRLGEISPDAPKELTKEAGLLELERHGKRLSELQERLFAAGTQGLLIVLQGRDTSGKDGAIRRLSGFLNVQSTRVVPFKAPSPVELDHDFLWRVHGHTPGKGEIAIFNRSHYEDVLAVRVHNLVPKHVWKRRYDHINAFESLLTDSDTIVLKFYLHITRDEQEERLLAREADPDKAWKLSLGDWKERELWDDYTDAFEAALSKCSPETAPWHVVPANKKWFRDLAIAEALVKALEPNEKQWEAALKVRGEAELAALRTFRAEG
ncbi:polyphosphate kinase 2 family protein [bacterium]|nr:MAG: polyphosphate kinase 2 family protein [bacterium]